jgi:alkanesulfonate monooxygenase SsuD/methylene tetrahydromethanopterin reductase-like flavin-dependent oxidoreductase (luciferase family)
MKDPFKDKEICFGVHLTPVGEFATLKENCLNAENLGYDLVTIWDHLMGLSDKPPFECWTLLASLAAITKRIQLGPLVSCVHFRHPTILAKMAVTVDLISGGRSILGLGAGWAKEEFESFLGRFPSMRERMDGLEDAAIICKSMLEGEHTDYQGKLYSAKDISRERSMPSPARGFIPIMIGSSGEKRGLKIAAKYADIVHLPLPLHPGVVEHKVKVLKKHCKDVGRDFDEITLSIFLHAVMEESQDLLEARTKVFSGYGITESEARESAEMTMGPKNLIRTIKFSHDIGIKLFTLSRFDPAQLEIFKKEVIMKL